MSREIAVQSYSRELVWRDGIPYLAHGQQITDKGLKELVPSVLSMPYVGTKITEIDDLGFPVTRLELEEEYIGLTNAEVMIIKEARKAASGDSEATHRLLDRVLGKPKQQNENLNVNASYADYLNALSEQEPQDTREYQEISLDEDDIDVTDL